VPLLAKLDAGLDGIRSEIEAEQAARNVRRTALAGHDVLDGLNGEALQAAAAWLAIADRDVQTRPSEVLGTRLSALLAADRPDKPKVAAYHRALRSGPPGSSLKPRRTRRPGAPSKRSACAS
jgi:hypothetical protein